MLSHQKWWFLSEEDEEQPGTDRDIDYYQHKCKENEDKLPPCSVKLNMIGSLGVIFTDTTETLHSAGCRLGAVEDKSLGLDGDERKEERRKHHPKSITCGGELFFFISLIDL